MCISWVVLVGVNVMILRRLTELERLKGAWMIKAKGAMKDGSPLAVFGLSKENLKRLQEGRPIKFNMNALGLADTTVVIFYGETEEQMAAELSEVMKRG